VAPTLRKVRSGDPLVIPAATFNAFVDAAQDFQGRQRSATQHSAPDWRQTGITPVRNDSGADRARFDVLGISGPVITPTANADAFKERVALKGIVPTAAHTGRFVVLLEPVTNGAIGRGVVAGVTIARVKIASEAHTLAEVLAGDAAKLQSADTGTATLLWMEPAADRTPDPTVAWTIIRLGAGGSAPPFRWAQVTEIQPTYVRARLLDTSGTQTGDPFDVRLYGGNSTGVTLTPTVADLTPHLVVGGYLRVVPQAGPDSAGSAWWSIDTFVETCP